MTFRQLLQFLEERVGSHQLPLNPAATGLRDLFGGVGLHHDWMKRLVQAIWHENRCTGLAGALERNRTFRAFESIRLDALRAPSTDIDLYRLLEDLAAALNERFGLNPRQQPVPAGAQASAEIIPLDSFRHRRFLRSRA